MNTKNAEITNLIQSNYRALYLWFFLEDIIKTQNLKNFAKDINIQTWPNTNFLLKKERIKNLLTQIYENPDKPNIFGYFTTINVFQNITNGMRELISWNRKFNNFLDKNLKNQAFNFKQIIIFSRNILSHYTSTPIKLKSKDYHQQKIYLLEKQKSLINFDFKYKKFFPKEWKGEKDYWIKIKINFKKLKEWDKLFDIISYHDFFLLSELCYNLSEIFKYYYIK